MSWRPKLAEPEERIAYIVNEVNKHIGFRTHANDEEAVQFWARAIKYIVEAEESTARIDEIKLLYGPQVAERARQWVWQQRIMEVRALDDMRKRRLMEESSNKGYPPVWEPSEA